MHHSMILNPYFEDHNFMAKYLPPQGCALYPIEQVWNVVKSLWKKTSYMALVILKKK
jgi:hypothetical protein